MQVRVIDFKSTDAPAEFAAGLKEIGFAVLSNHLIPPSLIDEAYEKWYEFFHSEEKHQFPFNAKTQDGYISKELSETAKGYDQKDLKEFYHYYLGQRCPASCFDVTNRLYHSLNNMGATLLDWLEKNCPADVQAKFSIPLPKMIENSSETMFRLIHYPPLTGNEPKGAMRSAAHEDIDLLTLLPAATAKGLQVKDAISNWLDIPINPGWIIVNAGDMLQECSGYYYPSTSHRVLNPTGEDAMKSRLSMPLFLHPRPETVLSAHHTQKSYLDERLRELGLERK